ncbi:cytochrome ubiquinol oxidase subunit I [bacterium]|nr:cytochrome ubiquinol oxidase subunit I [candidate division CSSED10-310 bacterium]
MDPVVLARLQFAFTIGFHFLFPPLTIGMAWLIVWIMNRYRKDPSSHYMAMARYWIGLFAVSFAIGVATGITMEFQFGTNWSEYSRFVGDIFGAPLAAEALFAFFLESTFLGVLLFGWKRFSPRLLWFASLMVAVGSTISAFWILVANSWMQTPAGFHMVGKRAELTSFSQAVFNPSTVPRFLHTMASALITGAFFMMGISAWYVLKDRHRRFARESMRMALVVACAAAVAELVFGHYHAIQVAHTQPEKLAAMEGLFETSARAPMLLFGIPDEEQARTKFAIRFPALLSLLAFGDPNRQVRGLNSFPRDEWPPVSLTFYPFHVMVALGMVFIMLTLWGIVLLRRGALFEHRVFLRLAVGFIPLPFIATQLGWITTEVGRQPWIVYRLIRTADAISFAVPAWQVLVSLLMFTVIYGLLFIMWLFLLARKIRIGPQRPGESEVQV